MNNLLWTYLIAISVLTITPGVDTVLVIRNTTRGGRRDGVASSFGICSGLFLHAVVSAIGISVILLQSAWAFRALKFAGAAYLVWLGIISLRKAMRRDGLLVLPDSKSRSNSFSVRRSLLEGFLCNALNPKAIVFYMAFLPQFIDPSGSALKQSLLLAGMHFVIAMVWQSLLACIVDKVKKWLENPKVRRMLDGMTGTIMLAFGIKLAMER